MDSRIRSHFLLLSLRFPSGNSRSKPQSPRWETLRADRSKRLRQNYLFSVSKWLVPTATGNHSLGRRTVLLRSQIFDATAATNRTRLSKSRTSISSFDGRRRYFLWIVQFRLNRIRNCSTGTAGDRQIRSKRTRPRTNSQSQFGTEKARSEERFSRNAETDL